MPIRVLAVDDEPDVLHLVEIKLKKAGFEVLTARDGEEGLQKALDERPEVVLLDVMMPKMDGFTVASRIKTQLHPPPLILMLSVMTHESDLATGFASGADDFIIKPFAPRELIERINVLLIKAGKTAAVAQEI
jgi:two-component system alkaline phosphatase synthesis response regulator PhoP